MNSKKKTIFATLALFTAINGFTLTIEPPHVTVSPFGTVMLGEANEYVYSSGKVLSELDWDILPVVSFGLGARVGWDGGLQLAGDVSAGLGLTTGSMADSDWLNLETNGDTAKTTFSKHVATLDFAYAANAQAGWEFRTPIRGILSDDRITITPAIGFKYLTMKWNAHDGYMQHTEEGTDGVYPAWSADQEKVPCDGTVISYQQEYWMPEARLEIAVPLGSKFRVTAACAGSLWVFCYGTDKHFVGTNYGTYVDFTGATVSNNYYDILSDGYMIEPELSFRWKALPKLTAFLEGKWTTIGSLRGNTAGQSSRGSAVYWWYESDGNGGAAAINAATIRLGVDITLL